MDIVDLILLKFNDLTKIEKKIAQYYIDNIESASEKTMHEISTELSVGDASIVRFCNKILNDSFKALHLRIAKELRSEKEAVKSNNNFIDIVKDSIVETIDSTGEKIDEKVLLEAARCILDSNMIVCVGSGSSGLSASSFAMRLMRYGKKANYINDPHFQNMYISQMKEDDLIIAYSITGESVDVIDSVTIGKERGVKVIAITNSKVSTLAQKVDYVINSSKRHNALTSGGLVGQIDQLFVSELLIKAYASFGEKDVLEAKELTYKSIANKVR